MNTRYFACLDCKIYVDAGYRWAYWMLEHPGVVQRGQPVDVSAVEQAAEFCNPPRDQHSGWLHEQIFPHLRQFFADHQGHQLIYGETYDFTPDDEVSFLDWLQVGHLPTLLPRSFAEQLGYTSWEQVVAHVEQSERKPFWWGLVWDDVHEHARRSFEQAVAAKARGGDHGE